MNTAQAAFVAALTASGLQFGYDLCVISLALPSLGAAFALSDVGKEAVVAVAFVGALLGSIVAGPLSERYGRKPCVSAGCCLFFAASLGIALSPWFAALILGRFCIGFAIGTSAGPAATLLAESAPTRWRGSLVSANELAICIGCLLSFVVNSALIGGGDVLHAPWRFMLGCAAVPSALQGMSLAFVSESPIWLEQRGSAEEASGVRSRLRFTEVTAEVAAGTSAADTASLRTLTSERNPLRDGRGMPTVCGEEGMGVDKNASEISGGGGDSDVTPSSSAVETISIADSALETPESEPCFAGGGDDDQVPPQPLQQQDDNQLLESGRDNYVGSWLILPYISLARSCASSSTHRQAVLLSLGCACVQNALFSNAMLYYSSELLIAVRAPPIIGSLGVGIAKLVGAAAATFVFLPRCRRRTILLSGMCVQVAAATAMGCAIATARPPVLLESLLLVFVAAWAASWAPGLFVVSTELLPSDVRGVAMGLVMGTFWLSSVISNGLLLSMFTTLGVAGSCFCIALSGACAIAWVALFLPETKDVELT